MRRDRPLCGLLLCLLATGAAAADRAPRADLVEGDLGRWLETAASELGETLSRHPRFQGETVRLVTLTPGAADGRSNRLAESVERRLRQRLLAIEGVRLAVDRPRNDCEPPPPIGYLVRIEVSQAGTRAGRIHIAVVDVAEAVWVSGISHQWQGRLSAAQRAALATPVDGGIPGSAARPIPLEDAEGVAAAMKADLACSLPRSLPGTLFVAAPEAPALSRVGLALQGALMYEPLAAVTPDRAQARWLLTLDADEADHGAAADVRQLNLTLADAGGGPRQRVASVFVSGLPGLPDGPVVADAVPVPQQADAPPREALPARRSYGLLTALEMHPARPEGICDDRGNRMNSCVEVTFELLEPAYLFVVSTREHQVVEVPCEPRLRRADAGTRRFRLRVPPGRFALDARETGPDAGFYVLASRERVVAEQLRAVLAAAPGQCSNQAAASPGPWLDRLSRVLGDHGGRVAWQALHVAHDTAGIVAL